MNISVLRRVCLTTRLQACPRGFVPSQRAPGRERALLPPHVFALPNSCDNRGRVSGYPNSLQFRRVQIFPAQHVHWCSGASSFSEDGAGNAQTSEVEKNVVLILVIEFMDIVRQIQCFSAGASSLLQNSSCVLSSIFGA